MSKKIRKGDTLTVGDLTDEYLGAEIEVEALVGITYRFTLGALGDDWYSQKELWSPKVRVGGFYPNTQVTIITPPWGRHPEQPTEMGTIIQIEGDPDSTCVVDYYGDILSLVGANHIPWETVKNRADDKGAKILVFKPTASYEDGLTDIETRDDWDPSKEELYRTRQWEDSEGDIWSFRDGSWGYARQDYGRWFELELPRYYTPLRLVPKDEEIS